MLACSQSLARKMPRIRRLAYPGWTKMDGTTGLAALTARVRHDLELTRHPHLAWMNWRSLGAYDVAQFDLAEVDRGK